MSDIKCDNCFFCGAHFSPLERGYKVRWHQAKGCRWVDIGRACEGCGETHMTHITSQNIPQPEVARP